MRIIRTIGALALAAVSAAACDDITNPIEEFGSLEDPFVRFADRGLVGTPGSTVEVVIELPTRVEEDVTVDYSFGGDAVFGEDFIPVDANGDPRADVTASGGTETIPFDFDDTAVPTATVRVFIPFDATDGAVLTVNLESAVTASGRELVTGFIPQFSSLDLSIEGFVTEGVATGPYAGTISGLISGDVSVTITEPASPNVIDGVAYSFVISDYGQGIFTGPIPWGFNVTSGGTVIFSPTDVAGIGVTSDVTGGTYNFDTGNLQFDVLLTCCGGEGFEWSYDVTAQ